MVRSSGGGDEGVRLLKFVAVALPLPHRSCACLRGAALVGDGRLNRELVEF